MRGLPKVDGESLVPLMLGEVPIMAGSIFMGSITIIFIRYGSAW